MPSFNSVNDNAISLSLCWTDFYSTSNGSSEGIGGGSVTSMNLKKVQRFGDATIALAPNQEAPAAARNAVAAEQVEEAAAPPSPVSPAAQPSHSARIDDAIPLIDWDNGDLLGKDTT